MQKEGIPGWLYMQVGFPVGYEVLGIILGGILLVFWFGDCSIPLSIKRSLKLDHYQPVEMNREKTAEFNDDDDDENHPNDAQASAAA